MSTIREFDAEIADLLAAEARRQAQTLELIASENFVHESILEAMGSVMTNKYAEGYPGRRYYGGCENVDKSETLAIERAKALFGADHANVQPHSGTQANMAVYFATLKPGDTLLGMDLSCGGHLSHGHPLNFTGKLYNVVAYGVDKETETVDYDEVARLAAEHKPKVIMTGFSAYSRTLDWGRFAEIARANDAFLVADIAHIAGLVATGHIPSPVPHADFVTSTTHKTLRGPRGGMILCREEHQKLLDRMTFPGIQGGPFEHVIAAKAVCYRLAAQPEFKEYCGQILANARVLAERLQGHGYRIVSGGTENHIVLVDTFVKGITGKVAEKALEKAGITTNKNTIPYDPNPPLVASGVRLGTPALTTRGMKEAEMAAVGDLIAEALESVEDETALEAVRGRVLELTSGFPLYPERQKI
jgi:glycine hydroxymethyltransferase